MAADNPGDDGRGENLWRFALALYARDGVAQALLTLQDRGGCNVGLMLYALWLGTRGLAMDEVVAAAAAAEIAPLASVVQQIRRLRRQLGEPGDCDIAQLRRQVMALELAAERRALARLAALAPTVPPTDCAAHGHTRLALADSNLARYLGEQDAAAERRLILAALKGLIRAG